MIYFWNDKQLARDLKNGAISEWHKFIYLMLYFFVPALFRLIGHILPHKHTEDIEKSFWMFSLTLIVIPLGLLFFYFLYKTNEKGDGLHFIERYICLTFPLIIRIMAIFIPAIVLGATLSAMFVVHSHNALGEDASIFVLMALPVAIVIALLVYYYLRFVTLLKIASGQTE